MDCAFAERGACAKLHTVDETRLGRFGEGAFADDDRVEMTFGVNGFDGGHSHTRTGNDPRAEMPMKLDDVGQPFGVGCFFVVGRLRQLWGRLLCPGCCSGEQDCAAGEDS